VAQACGCNAECATCEGTGRIHLVKDGYSYVKPCDCRSITARVLRFNQARLPARCGLSFDEFLPVQDEQEKALMVAKTTAHRYRPDAPSKGFIVSGPVGSGKTHLLCATLRHLTLELGIPAKYVEISFLFAEIRDGFSKKKSGLDAIQPLIDTEVLAIDELGKGRGSPFELDTLDELIARRYNAGKTTLFATNYSLSADRPRSGGYVDPADRMGDRPADLLLRERVGERIYSRLQEMCHSIQFPPTTPDHRRSASR
jgi:DNA replication protein DnaC